MPAKAVFALLALSLIVGNVGAQSDDSVPSTYPHVYPGQPNAPYGPVWQKCKQELVGFVPIFSLLVQISRLPNLCPMSHGASFCRSVRNRDLTNLFRALPRSFAGNLPVQRAGHPNDTLFL